ncbi:MAG: tocopherol cyclase family protein [Phototrophicaceae bacterium]|jgi:hypothetical protein
MSYISQVLHPERFHGHNIRNGFFEGWYYKLIDATEQHRLAVIPGIFLFAGEDAKAADTGDNHCFIQVLDGMAGTASYHHYPKAAFIAAQDDFRVQVGQSEFTYDCLRLDIHDEQRTVQGEVRFQQITPWPVTLASPGVMGPFAWIPQMECYHGVLSFNHALEGTLQVDGQMINFTGGRGYLEKDWGKGFPSGYVWMQTNHFDNYGTSFEGAIAIIPIVGKLSFRGFQCGVWHDGQLYKFTTYNGTQVKAFTITDHLVTLVYANSQHQLEIQAERAEGTLLHAPIRTQMHRRVNETLKASVHIHLKDRTGRTIFQGTGRNAGLEVHGDLDRLLSYR